MLSTRALRIMSIIGAVVCAIGVIFAVILGVGLLSRVPAPPWLATATTTALIVGVPTTVLASVALARRPKDS